MHWRNGGPGRGRRGHGCGIHRTDGGWAGSDRSGGQGWRFAAPVDEGGRRLSVVFEPSHPRRPVFRLDRAGFGPGSGGIVRAVPFEGPEFLQAHSPNGPTHEDALVRTFQNSLYTRTLSITHTAGATLCAPVVVRVPWWDEKTSMVV